MVGISNALIPLIRLVSIFQKFLTSKVNYEIMFKIIGIFQQFVSQKSFKMIFPA